MTEISYQHLKKASALFAGIPIFLFFWEWLSIPAAIIFTVLLAGAFLFSFRNISDDDGTYISVQLSKKQLLLVGVIALLWCIAAGQGSIFNQTSDHEIRNKIITDLTLKSFPVTYHDGKNMLSYYIVYWMLPCSLGKLVYLISGSTFPALLTSNICLLIQSTFGIVLTFLLILLTTQQKEKKINLKPLFFFIFFSGLDIIGMLLRRTTYFLMGDHMEWWALFFQYSSNTTCLFWVYNQTIPIWIITLCLINEKHMKDFAFLPLLAFPHGPFPFVGLFVFCIIRAVLLILDTKKDGTLANEIRLMLSAQNFLSVLAVAPVFILYFTANGIVSNAASAATELSGGQQNDDTAVNTSFRFHSVVTESAAKHDIVTMAEFWLSYLLFVLLEFVFYATILIHRNINKYLTACVSVALLIIPLFQIGYSADFCMRASIPLLLYLCIMLIRLIMSELPEKGEFNSLDAFIRGKTVLTVALFLFALGCSTPVMEISRQTLLTGEYIFCRDTTDNDMIRFDYENIQTMEEEGEYGNFFAVNYKDSLFYRYFCKK